MIKAIKELKTNLTSIAKRLIRNNLKFKMRHNLVYSPQKYQELLVLMSKDRGYAEGTVKIFAKDKQLPSADALLYHIKKFKPFEVIELFDQIQEKIIKLWRKSPVFQRNTPLMMAIDFTDIPYYGKFDGDKINKVSHETMGTQYCHKYAVLSIVEEGVKFIVKTLPLYYEENRNEVIEKLVDYARARFNIKIILFDRGFYSSIIMSMLDKRNIDFCIFVPKNQRIKKAIMAIESLGFDLPWVYSHKMANIEYKHKMHFVKGRDEILAIASNSIYDGSQLLELYNKRWSIETNFRSINQFRPMTTSQNFTIRLFYQLFAQMIFNLWILVRLIGSNTLDQFYITIREFKQTLITDYFDLGIFRA